MNDKIAKLRASVRDCETMLIHFDCHGKIPITSRDRKLPVHPFRIIFPFFAYVSATQSSSTSRKEGDNPIYFLFLPRMRVWKNPISIFHSLRPIARGRARVVNTNILASGQTTRRVATPPSTSGLLDPSNDV